MTTPYNYRMSRNTSILVVKYTPASISNIGVIHRCAPSQKNAMEYMMDMATVLTCTNYVCR